MTDSSENAYTIHYVGLPGQSGTLEGPAVAKKGAVWLSQNEGTLPTTWHIVPQKDNTFLYGLVFATWVVILTSIGQDLRNTKS